MYSKTYGVGFPAYGPEPGLPKELIPNSFLVLYVAEFERLRVCLDV